MFTQDEIWVFVKTVEKFFGDCRWIANKSSIRKQKILDKIWIILELLNIDQKIY